MRQGWRERNTGRNMRGEAGRGREAEDQKKSRKDSPGNYRPSIICKIFETFIRLYQT